MLLMRKSQAAGDDHLKTADSSSSIRSLALLLYNCFVYSSSVPVIIFVTAWCSRILHAWAMLHNMPQAMYQMYLACLFLIGSSSPQWLQVIRPLPLSKGLLCVGIRCKHHVTMLCDPVVAPVNCAPSKNGAPRLFRHNTPRQPHMPAHDHALQAVQLCDSPLAISKHRMLATFLLYGTWMVRFPLCITIARHTPMIITHAWLPDTTTCWLLLGLPGVGAGVELPCLS